MLGDKIKQIRKTKNIKQKEFAEMLNIPVSTLANYENNHRQPSIETLNKMSELLKVSISEFLKEDKKTTLLNKKTGDIVSLNTPSVTLEESNSKIKLMNITTEIVTELEDSIHEYLAVISPVEKKGFDSDKVNELVNKVTELIRFEIYKEKENKNKQ